MSLQARTKPSSLQYCSITADSEKSHTLYIGGKIGIKAQKFVKSTFLRNRECAGLLSLYK